MTANGGDDELDALVDSILQSRHRPTNTRRMSQRLPSPKQQRPSNPGPTPSQSGGLSVNKTALTRQRGHTSSDGHNTYVRTPMHAVSPGGSCRNVGNFAPTVPPTHHASTSTSRAMSTHLDAGDGEDGEEEDLNALVERILAGSGPCGPHSTSESSRHAQERQNAPPSAAVFTSSPHFSQVSPLHIGSSEASSRKQLGGATRVQGGSHSQPRMFGTDSVSRGARMQAVVRRLALWYERKEAKRVQAVYEALEREQQDCTFEPSINHLEVEVGSSVAIDEEGHSLGQHYCDPDEEPHYLSLLSKARGVSSNRAVSHTNTISMPLSSSRDTSHMCEYIPSLQPPSQPIAGADVFVERLRRAQDERDAAREAEEAKRLHYYDPTTFRRGITVSAPFEFADTRPRRLGTVTAAVTSAPSRGLSGAVGDARSNPPPLSARAAAFATYKDAGATPPPTTEKSFHNVDASKHTTAENTFLSLAPHIRQTLLFGRQMELQLRRATDRVRCRTGVE
nr:unnamed protein product [Leishmania braziliensis]